MPNYPHLTDVSVSISWDGRSDDKQEDAHVEIQVESWLCTEAGLAIASVDFFGAAEVVASKIAFVAMQLQDMLAAERQVHSCDGTRVYHCRDDKTEFFHRGSEWPMLDELVLHDGGHSCHMSLHLDDGPTLYASVPRHRAKFWIEVFRGLLSRPFPGSERSCPAQDDSDLDVLAFQTMPIPTVIADSSATTTPVQAELTDPLSPPGAICSGPFLVGQTSSGP